MYRLQNPGYKKLCGLGGRGYFKAANSPIKNVGQTFTDGHSTLILYIMLLILISDFFELFCGCETLIVCKSRPEAWPVEGVQKHLVGHSTGKDQSRCMLETKLFFHLPADRQLPGRPVGALGGASLKGIVFLISLYQPSTLRRKYCFSWSTSFCSSQFATRRSFSMIHQPLIMVWLTNAHAIGEPLQKLSFANDC